MSDNFLIIHKPQNVKQAANANTEVSKTPKRRKSIRGGNRESLAPSKPAQAAFDSDDCLNAYKNFEKKINLTKREIHQNLYKTICDSTIDYYNYYETKRKSYTYSNSAREFDSINPICHVIPTIALHTGINAHDYNHLSDSLVDHLRTNFTKYLFVLNEKNASNLKSLIASICFQSEDKLNNGKALKQSMFTFRNFFGSLVEQNLANHVTTHRIVFIFKQFELIPKETIEAFVSLISCHVEKVSVYFIFEISSQSNIINEQLSSSTISKLCIRKVHAMPPEQYIDKFLTKLFIEQLTLFRVSDEILDHLIELYYEYNLSMNNLIYALKFCFYDHLRSHQLNALLLNEESIIQDETMAGEILLLRQDWFQFQNEYIFMAKILFEILKRFPSEQDDKSLFYTTRTNFIEFYCKLNHLTMSQKFVETNQYNNLKKLLLLSSASTVNEIVSSLVNLIIEQLKLKPNERYQEGFVNEMNGFLNYLMDYQSKKNEPANNGNEFNKMITKDDCSLLRKRVERRSSVKILKPVSQNTDSSAPSKPNQQAQTSVDLNKFKLKLIEWLTIQFANFFNSEYLANNEQMNQHFCYSNFKLLKKRLFHIQRLNKHYCLSNSFSYLKLDSFMNKKNGESPMKKLKRKSGVQPAHVASHTQMPLNAIYKLYLEFGHMINLYDWLLAFVEKLENADIEELEPNKKKILQALFFRSITELQFMGYIKPTSRKVDHVVKLTNGSNLLAIESETIQSY